jgi:hypothetical protein
MAKQIELSDILMPEYMRELTRVLVSHENAIVFSHLVQGFTDGSLESYSEIGGNVYRSLEDLKSYLSDEFGYSKKDAEKILDFAERNIRN